MPKRRNLSQVIQADITTNMPLASIAELLQAHGRGRDTILAHITPKEAKLLKDRGGRGSTNPHTGLPEFDDGAGGFDFSAGDFGAQMAAPTSAPSADVSAAPAPTADVSAAPSAGFDTGMAAPSYGGATPDVFASAYQQPALATQTFAQAAPTMYTGPTPTPSIAPTPPGGEQPSFLEDLAKQGKQFFTQPKNILGTAGLGGAALYNLITSGRAQKQAQAIEQELRSQAAPYEQQAQQLMQLSQAGGLTAANQQALEARRAQMAQGVARTGGVGAQQAAVDYQQTYAQMLDEQIQFALQLSGIADAITQKALTAGYQASAAARDNSTKFFSALANAGVGMFGGQPSK
jgi:hypothetical protein